MDQSTHAVRRANWLNIVHQCQNRPADISVKQWLAENDIKEKAYYCWLRKFRKEVFNQMQLPAITTPAEGKNFYERLKKHGVLPLTENRGTDTMHCVSVSIRAKVQEIVRERLALIFEKSTGESWKPGCRYQCGYGAKH